VERWTGGRSDCTRDGSAGGVGAAGIGLDFLASSVGNDQPQFDFVHRQTRDADIYFVANRLDRRQEADCSFRISARQPELWDPISGEVRDAEAFRQEAGRTVVPLYLPANGSIFVVFRRAISSSARGDAASNAPQTTAVHELAGPWQVEFDSRKGGPADPVPFEKLASWTTHSEPTVRYYSGPAVYRTTFDLPGDLQPALDERRWWIDLGEVKNVAAVTLNGSELGVAWTDPFRIEATGHLRLEGNELAIEVTNLWPNRLIGDRSLPRAERHTSTNIRKFDEDSPLLESGLLGPVRLMRGR
jgi:hypothetical protein